jgi:hypothetical protein
MEASDLTS